MTSRRVHAPVAGLLSAALCAVGLASCTSTLGYAAKVNGVAISQSSINDQLAEIATNKQYVTLIDKQAGTGPFAGTTAGTYNKAFVAQLLDRQIRFEIIRQRLVTAHALPTAAQVNAAKSTVAGGLPTGLYAAFPPSYQTLLATQQAEINSFITAVTATLTGDGYNQYYQAHQSDYATEACARHILIADRNPGGVLDYPASLVDAQKVKAMLDSGGDFAALAKQYSQDNQGTTGGSAAAGGAVTGTASDGCLSTADLRQLVAEFAQVVVSLPINQASAPVKTQFGYHLIEVTSRVVEPLDAKVTKDIQQRQAGVDLNTLVSRAKVSVNPEFGSFDTKVDAIGAIPGVVPPVVPSLGPTTPAPRAAAGAAGAAGAASGG